LCLGALLSGLLPVPLGAPAPLPGLSLAVIGEIGTKFLIPLEILDKIEFLDISL